MDSHSYRPWPDGSIEARLANDGRRARAARDPLMRRRDSLLVLAALLTVGCDTSVDANTPPPGSTDITAVDWGRDFELTDHRGQVRRLVDFEDRVVLLFFGFTHCPDICPTTLADLAQALEMLDTSSRRVQVMFVTVDPERDTPKRLADYVTNFHPEFLGLYTDPAKTAALAKAFKFHHAAHAPDSAGAYDVEHGSWIYAYGPVRPAGQPRRRLLIAARQPADAIAADVRWLLNSPA